MSKKPLNMIESIRSDVNRPQAEGFDFEESVSQMLDKLMISNVQKLDIMAEVRAYGLSCYTAGTQDKLKDAMIEVLENKLLESDPLMRLSIGPITTRKTMTIQDIDEWAKSEAIKRLEVQGE